MSTKSILVVEDDVHFGKQIVDLFSFLGYSTELVADGKSAVDRFKRGSFDLVLSDLMLPEMNGVDVIKAIRGMPHGVGVPVLMMSAVYRNPKLFQRELRDLAIIEFLPKPFSIVDLGRRISLVLETGAAPIDDSAITQSGSWSSLELRASLGESRPDFDLTGTFDRLRLLNLFIEVFDKHHPGTLVLEHAQSKRTVCFLNGYPVWGESNEPTESLAAILERNAELDPVEIRRLVTLAAAQGKPLREILLAEGALSERRLFLAERNRVRQVVLGCFAMAQGQFKFVPGDDFVERVGVFEVNPVRCLGEVVQRYLSANELAPEVYAAGGRHLVRGKRYRQLFPYLDLPESLSTLGAQLKRGSTVNDLFGSFASARDDLLRILWLMLRLGIAEQRTASAPDQLDVRRFSNPAAPVPVRPETLSEPFSQADGMDKVSRTVLADYLTLIEADLFAVLGV
ncbi:MAG: response regulator, partial [Deltaproteobacteria bacterium]|nr:response regulator [Deltaproteobacteria bacterium]